MKTFKILRLRQKNTPQIPRHSPKRPKTLILRQRLLQNIKIQLPAKTKPPTFSSINFGKNKIHLFLPQKIKIQPKRSTFKPKAPRFRKKKKLTFSGVPPLGFFHVGLQVIPCLWASGGSCVFWGPPIQGSRILWGSRESQGSPLSRLFISVSKESLVPPLSILPLSSGCHGFPSSGIAPFHSPHSVAPTFPPYPALPRVPQNWCPAQTPLAPGNRHVDPKPDPGRPTHRRGETPHSPAHGSARSCQREPPYKTLPGTTQDIRGELSLPSLLRDVEWGQCSRGGEAADTESDGCMWCLLFPFFLLLLLLLYPCSSFHSSSTSSFSYFHPCFLYPSSSIPAPPSPTTSAHLWPPSTQTHRIPREKQGRSRGRLGWGSAGLLAAPTCCGGNGKGKGGKSDGWR